MNLQEAIEEAKAQINQADYLLETTSGVYKTGLQKVYGNKSELLRVLVLHAQRAADLQSKIDSGELVKVVHSHKIPIMRETAVFDWKCENCDMPMCDDDLYCPNCGAKMDSK